LFGLGLKEMLADEITTDLRQIRELALTQAKAHRTTVTESLTSKGISYGSITATASGTVITDQVQGVDPDLACAHSSRTAGQFRSENSRPRAE